LHTLNNEIASAKALLNSYHISCVNAKDKRQKLSIMNYLG
jgi:hypothetical protein